MCSFIVAYAMDAQPVSEQRAELWGCSLLDDDEWPTDAPSQRTEDNKVWDKDNQREFLQQRTC